MDAGTLTYRLLVEASAFNNALSQADRDAEQSGKRVGQQFSKAVQSGLNSSNFSLAAPLTRVEDEVRRSGGRMSSTLNSIFQGVGQAIGTSLIGAITGAVSFGISQIKTLSSTIVSVGSNAENMRIAFTAILRDADKANKLLAEMRQFSAATPYTGKEVQEASQKLLTVVKPEEMITTLRRLGDVAAGTKSSLSDLTTIYQQVLSKGKVQAEEMIQFAERGIPIQEAMARVLGVSGEELAKMQQAGKVSSDVLVKAFSIMADKGGQFNAIMDKQSKTLTGIASTMKDKFELAAIQVYEKINPALVAMLKSLDQATSKASEQSTMLDLIGNIAEKIAGWFEKNQGLINAAAVATAQWLEGALKGVAETIGGVYGWFQKHPGLIKEIGKQTKLWGDGLRIVWNFAQSLEPAFSAVAVVLEKILAVFNAMGEALQNLVTKAGEFASALGAAVSAQDSAASGSFGGNAPGVDAGFYSVVTPQGGRVKAYGDLTAHHSYQRTNAGEARDFTLHRGGTSAVPVPSPVQGRVIATPTGGKGGNMVILRADDGSMVKLAHFADNTVRVKTGDEVMRGQYLGTQGRTGSRVTGVHTHIEAPTHIVKDYINRLNNGDWGNATRTGTTQGFAAGAAAVVNAQRNGSSARTKASFYGENDGFHGRKTSTGDIFDKNAMTAATTPSLRKQHGLKYGDYVEVTNPTTGKKVTVRLNDNMPDNSRGRGFDLSTGAARQLGLYDQGVGDVQFRKVSAPTPTAKTSPVGAKVAGWTSSPQENKQNAEELKRQAEDRAREQKKNQEMIAQARRALDDSQLKAVEAEAANSKDLRVKAEVQIRRQELELKQKLEDLKSSGYPAGEQSKIAANYRRETQASITGIRQKLTDDLKQQTADEAKAKQEQAEKNRQELERQRQEARERAERILEGDLTLTQSQIDLAKAKAELNSDFLGKLRAQEMQIGLDMDRALLALDKEATQNQLPQAQVSQRRNAIIELSNNRMIETQQEYQKGEEQRRGEIQKTINDRIRGAITANYARRDNRVETELSIAGSNLGLLQQRAASDRNPDTQVNLQREAARGSIQMELTQQLHQIQQLERSGDYAAESLARMRQNAEAIAQIKMDDVDRQFRSLGETIGDQARGAFSSFLTDVLSGTKTINAALSDMLGNLAAQLLQMGINRALGGLFGFADGGVVSAHASGGLAGQGRQFSRLDDAMRFEKFASGRQPKLVIAHEGELMIPHNKLSAFAEGNFEGGTRGGNNFNLNLGDLNVNGGGLQAGDAEKLMKLIKASVYGILENEHRAGGMFSRR